MSTPARPVFDASTRTRKRADGSGGRCLNDLVTKGAVKNMNLIKLLLRFTVGKCAGDKVNNIFIFNSIYFSTS